MADETSEKDPTISAEPPEAEAMTAAEVERAKDALNATPAPEAASEPTREAAEPSEVLPKDDVSEPEPGESPPDTPAFNIEVVGENVAEAMDKLRTNVEYWVSRGRYNKLRIKRKGKPVLPDIPIGALMAVEAATFFWTGLLRGALVNVVGRAFFQVELINEAEEHYKRGLEHFLSGDLAEAEQALEKALEIDQRLGKAHLQLGVVRKIQGRTDDAIAHFEHAIGYADRKTTRKEAEIHLKRMHEARAAAGR